MSATSVVRARISEDVKDAATAVAEGMGITISDILRMTLTRVAMDGAMPFEIKVPNAQTRAAMAESRRIMASRKTRRLKGEELFHELERKVGKAKAG
jgi:DNA-damage-inducible protein J